MLKKAFLSIRNVPCSCRRFEWFAKKELFLDGIPHYVTNKNHKLAAITDISDLSN